MRLTPAATSASAIASKAAVGRPGEKRADRLGSPRPTTNRSPSRRPFASSRAAVSSVVRSRASGPYASSVAAVVTSLSVDAGRNAFSELSA
jgi:hypothetical protein